MFGAGGFLLQQNSLDATFDIENKEHIYLVETVEIPVEKSNTYSVQCKVIEGFDSISKELENEKFILYIKKDTISTSTQVSQIDIATNLLIKAKIAPANYSSQALGFDYDKYLKRKGICGVAFINPESYFITDIDSHKNLATRLNQLQAYLVSRFSLMDIDKDNIAILSAITLGEKALLSTEQKNYFSSAGASHILVVSGMHVGYIFALIFLLLRYIPTKRNRWLVVLCGILLMWFYASLTGLAPSVVRATFIFSLMLFMQMAGLRYKVSNAIFISATILLIVNPNTLFDVGFQLSYLAYISILFFLPRLNKLMLVDKIENTALRWLVLVINVALAAQILTMPIVIFHFHQLPIYFIFTNLIVSLFAPIIFFGGFIALICSFIPYISIFIGTVINYLLSAFNYLVEGISALPLSVAEGTISLLQCIIIYLCLYFIAEAIVAFENSNKNRVLSVAKVVVAFSVLIIISFETIYHKNSISQLIVNDTNKLSIDINNLNNHIQINDRMNSCFEFDNQSYMVLCDDDIFNYKINKGNPIEVDYLIIDKGVYPTDRLLQFISPQYVILTKAVWYENALMFEELFNSNSIECYNIAIQGAFINTVH